MGLSCIVCTRHRPSADGDCTSDCRHRDVDVLDVCGPCAQRVRDDLDVIARAWHADAPVPTGVGRNSDPPLPGGTEWLDWREGADLRDILGGWARVWHEDMTNPPAWPGMDPGRLVAWLRAWWDQYGAGHEAAREFADDVHDLGRRARRLVGDVPVGQIVPCPGLDEPCGRRLRINVADPDERIRCRCCGTEWTAGRLLVHQGEGDGLLDAAAIAEIFGVPGSTLRRWSAAGRVRREGLRYSVADVREVMVSSHRLVEQSS